MLTLLAGGSLGFTCGGPTLPTTETCTPEAPLPGGEPNDGATISSLEIGRMEGAAFIPFVDDQIAFTQFGGQGSQMIIATLRLRGTAIPACLAQKTVMEQVGGSLISSEEAALPLDPAGDGSLISAAMFLIYSREPGLEVELRSEVGSVTTSVTVWVDQRGADLDGGIDAAMDAGVDGP